MTTCACYLTAPIAGFRSPWAREYFETLPVPPPSTVYGMLLSAVGEPDRLAHQGVELGIGLLNEPTRVRVFRTLWRIKDPRAPLGLGENKRPDFQELLVDLRLVIHVRTGDDRHQPPLVDRLQSAVDSRGASVRRWGALAIGESTHLVDEFRFLRAEETRLLTRWLLAGGGLLALPVWADHVGSAHTQFVQCRFVHGQAGTVPEGAWLRIGPSDAGEPRAGEREGAVR